MQRINWNSRIRRSHPVDPDGLPGMNFVSPNHKFIVFVSGLQILLTLSLDALQFTSRLVPCTKLDSDYSLSAVIIFSPHTHLAVEDGILALVTVGVPHRFISISGLIDILFH
jgi:hypothetical protein